MKYKKDILTILNIILITVVINWWIRDVKSDGYKDGLREGVDMMRHELVVKGYAEYYEDEDKKNSWRMKTGKKKTGHDKTTKTKGPTKR